MTISKTNIATNPNNFLKNSLKYTNNERNNNRNKTLINDQIKDDNASVESRSRSPNIQDSIIRNKKLSETAKMQMRNIQHKSTLSILKNSSLNISNNSISNFNSDNRSNNSKKENVFNLKSICEEVYSRDKEKKTTKKSGYAKLVKSIKKHKGLLQNINEEGGDNDSLKNDIINYNNVNSSNRSNTIKNVFNSPNKENSAYSAFKNNFNVNGMFNKSKEKRKPKKQITLNFGNNPDLDITGYLEKLNSSNFNIKDNLNKQLSNRQNSTDQKDTLRKKNSHQTSGSTTNKANLNDKKIKIYSKYSDLVLGDRMNDDEKLELGIINKKRNRNFKANIANKDARDFNDKNNSKARDNNKSSSIISLNSLSNSFIKFTHKTKTIDINNDFYYYDLYRNTSHNDLSSLNNKNSNNNSSNNKNIRLTTIEKRNNKIVGIGDKEFIIKKPNLSTMIKNQFTKIRINNLLEPEKLIESSQDKFIRNKHEFVLDFQEVNRNIGK